MDYDEDDYEETGPPPHHVAASFAGGALAAVAVAALGPLIPFVVAAAVATAGITSEALKDP